MGDINIHLILVDKVLNFNLNRLSNNFPTFKIKSDYKNFNDVLIDKTSILYPFYKYVSTCEITEKGFNCSYRYEYLNNGSIAHKEVIIKFFNNLDCPLILFDGSSDIKELYDKFCLELDKDLKDLGYRFNYTNTLFPYCNKCGKFADEHTLITELSELVYKPVESNFLGIEAFEYSLLYCCECGNNYIFEDANFI
jgi:hypothetical protein